MRVNNHQVLLYIATGVLALTALANCNQKSGLAGSLGGNSTNGSSSVSGPTGNPTPTPNPTSNPTPSPTPVGTTNPTPNPTPVSTPQPTPQPTPVSGAPATPTNFLLTSEGVSTISLMWTSVPGATSYNIYRNGGAKPYANVIANSYTDNAATNATATTTPSAVSNFSGPASSYSYVITAVNSHGESLPQSNLVYWMYNTNTTVNNNPATGNPSNQNAGVSSSNPPIPGNFITGRYDCATTANAADTSGNPGADSLPTPFDYLLGGCTYYQPFSGPPTVPSYALSLAPFNYMILDLNPTAANSFSLQIISRISDGVTPNGADLLFYTFVPLNNYGPAPVVGQWASYKVPLTELAIGTANIVGSISGSTLTVTSVTGAVIQPGSFLSGNPNIPVGTYVSSVTTAYGGSGSPGTYVLSQSVTGSVPAGSSITGIRNNMYKFHVQTDGSSNFEMNNVGFTAQ